MPYPPNLCTSVQSVGVFVGGYGIPAIPTQPSEFFPQNHSEFACASPPTDFTDVHRFLGCVLPPNLCTSVQSVGVFVGGYGIPAIPTLPSEFLPQNPFQVCLRKSSHGIHGIHRNFWRRIFSHRIHRIHRSFRRRIFSHRIHRNFWRRIFSHGFHRTHRTFWQIRASHRLHRCSRIFRLRFCLLICAHPCNPWGGRRRVWHPCHTHAALRIPSTEPIPSLFAQVLPQNSRKFLARIFSHGIHGIHRSFRRRIFSHGIHGIHRNFWRRIFSHGFHRCT